MVRRHYATVNVEVDVTDEVETLSASRAKEVALSMRGERLGIAHLDLDAATLGILRLARRGEATPERINGLLLDLIGSDSLRRLVGGAMKGGR